MQTCAVPDKTHSVIQIALITQLHGDVSKTELTLGIKIDTYNGLKWVICHSLAPSGALIFPLG